MFGLVTDACIFVVCIFILIWLGLAWYYIDEEKSIFTNSMLNPDKRYCDRCHQVQVRIKDQWCCVGVIQDLTCKCHFYTK